MNSKKFLLLSVIVLGVLNSNIFAKTIVVFIHGTVLPGLSLLDVSGACNDELDEGSRYVAAVQRVRRDTRFWEDQPVLGEGLWPVTTISNQEQTDTCKHEERFAVYPLTRAFDAVAHWSGYLDGEVDYYTFGHLGLLSQKYRKEQGYKLYKELECLVRKEKEPVRLIICAHSHGGNIALFLAAAEEEQRKGLFVDDLLLFGTPVQIETAHYAFKKPFKRVVNFFSANDTVQLADWVSTKGGASFRTFTVPHKHGACRYMPPYGAYGQVIDMRCMVNDDSRVLTHQNLWYLGRSRRLCPSLELLPLMVMTPIYVTLLRSHVTSYKMLVDAHLRETNCSGLTSALVFPGNEIATLSQSEAEQLGKVVRVCDRDAQMHWKPLYKHRILLLYREDFMREMLGFFSWVDLKVRMWGYTTFKSVRSWFACS